MKFNEALRGIGPEAFHAIDIDLAPGDSVAVVHPQRPIPTEHERVIAMITVGVHDTAAADLLHGQIQQRGGLNIGNNLDVNNPSPLQNAQDGDCARRPAPPLALPPTTTVGFIGFDFSLQQLPTSFILGQDAPSDRMHRSQGGGVADPHFPSDPPSRALQLTQRQDPQPLHGTEPTPTHPAPRKLPQGVVASGAVVPASRSPVHFSASTAQAETTGVFPTPFGPVPIGRPFGLDQSRKSVNAHPGTSLSLVPDVLQSPKKLRVLSSR